MDFKEKTKLLETIGARINKFRLDKNLSYRQLAQICDVDHSQISKIEKGLVSFEILTLIELAKGLDVHPKVLLDIEI